MTLDSREVAADGSWSLEQTLSPIVGRRVDCNCVVCILFCSTSCSAKQYLMLWMFGVLVSPEFYVR